MSNYIDVIAIVEGRTEQIFVESLLQPYLAQKNIFIRATQVSKPGQKGGDVKFERVKKDLELHLKQRSDTYVTTFVDYYGVKDWPGVSDIPTQATPLQIAQTVNNATKALVLERFTQLRADIRFIPYMAIHEFEAFLFSDSSKLASQLEIDEKLVLSVLTECGEPEAINNSRETAPSKRLDKWSKNGSFPKTSIGITLARAIGIQTIREKCPIFNNWLQTLESIVTAKQALQ